MRKRLSIAIAILVVIAAAILLSSCMSAADVASDNISTAADNFEIYRRIIFYNSITDTYILTVEGYCSLGNYDPDDELSVTCKLGDGTYVKHFLGLSDNVTYIAEHLSPSSVDNRHYRVIFRPSTILPSVEVQP